MLAALLKILQIFHQSLCIMKNTVRMFTQILWLENIMTLVYIELTIKPVNQFLLMYFSLKFLTQLKTFTI